MLVRFLYQLAANVAGPPAAVAAALKGRFGGRWRERLGLRFAPSPVTAHPRIWIHGSSVGEIKSAAAIIRAFLLLRPESEIVLSAMTPAGLETAQNLFYGEKRIITVAAPLDFWGSPGRALARLKPSALVIMETELWPNFIRAAQKANIKLVMAAARMTSRSYRRYSLIKNTMADLLACFDLIAASGEMEKEYFASLGVPIDRLEVLGNPKFDNLPADVENQAFKEKVEDWKKLIWGGEASGILLTAGSTHKGEDEIIIRAFVELAAAYKNLRLILAPRHINRERVDELAAIIKNNGLTPLQVSKTAFHLDKPEKVLILDQIGQLQTVYALSDVAVVGGSLIEGLAGHNPLEPAAVSRPMVFGPNMSSFALEAKGLVESGGALFSTGASLADDLEPWIKDHKAARLAGEKGKRFMESRQPAAPALAAALDRIMRTGDKDEWFTA